MMAAELAAAGKDVLVVEKGGYYNEADFSGLEADDAALFLRRGALSTADLGMVVLAGSTLGGGTIVNWSTSLRTPPEVLEEWEREHGVDGAATGDYLKGFEEAERRLGIRRRTARPIATTRPCATAARSSATSGSHSAQRLWLRAALWRLWLRLPVRTQAVHDADLPARRPRAGRAHVGARDGRARAGEGWARRWRRGLGAG